MSAKSNGATRPSPLMRCAGSHARCACGSAIWFRNCKTAPRQRAPFRMSSVTVRPSALLHKAPSMIDGASAFFAEGSSARDEPSGTRDERSALIEEPSATRDERSATKYEASAVFAECSAMRYEHSATRYERSATFADRQGLICNPLMERLLCQKPAKTASPTT